MRSPMGARSCLYPVSVKEKLHLFKKSPVEQGAGGALAGHVDSDCGGRGGWGGSGSGGSAGRMAGALLCTATACCCLLSCGSGGPSAGACPAEGKAERQHTTKPGLAMALSSRVSHGEQTIEKIGLIGGMIEKPSCVC